MTQDELKAAYQRFEARDKDSDYKLDEVCLALDRYMQVFGDESYIVPNRVAAMMAIEAMHEWAQAEAEKP